MRREKETDGLRFERVKSLFLSWLLDLDLDLCNLFFSINVPIYTHKIILLYYENLYIFFDRRMWECIPPMQSLPNIIMKIPVSSPQTTR